MKFSGNVPSPGSSVPSLNTPLNPSSNAGPSPLGQEDIAYREKVRQLSKYIEPLRKMIARIGNEGNNVENQRDNIKFIMLIIAIIIVVLLIYRC